jgi:hypothetical protein
VWFAAKLPNSAANFFDSSFGVGGHCKSLVQLIPSEKYTAYCMSEPAGGRFEQNLPTVATQGGSG